MDALDWQAWMTLLVIAAIAVALLRDLARPDLVFLGGLGVLLLAGVLTPNEAFAGFSNTAVLTIGALFVVAAGVQRTDALGFLDRLLFGKKAKPTTALLRLMAPTAALSSILNNTPIVAMLTPRVQQWAQQVGIPVSRLLIPLSYAAIVGGLITLIGTSTNIIVSGLLEESGYPPFGMFDLTWVGLPAALGVILFMAFIGYRLLPISGDEKPMLAEGLKNCLFELRVAQNAPFIGQSIDEANLRALGRAYLIHIRRGERLVPATPGEVLRAGDILAFVGDSTTLELLLARPGLERTLEMIGEQTLQTLPLYEAVVADSSNLVGKTLKSAHFRETYGGVVLAIQRRGERMHDALGRVPIKAGDLLLVEAQNGFDNRWNANRDEFYLVAGRKTRSMRALPGKAPIALLLLTTMFLLVAFDVLSLVTAVFAAALGMLVTRCLSGSEARQAVNLQVLVVIAAALGLGQAIVKTGLAGALAGGLAHATAGVSPLIVLAILYLTTNLLTEVITHKAAAVLMLPIALATATDLGLDPKALAILITVAAAASFSTPIGYQTNLMVMSAGGYRFRDYLRAGVPVSLVVMTITVSVVYYVWVL